MAHNKNPEISDLQKQYILGTILGGSSLIKSEKSKTAYLSMRCIKGKWLEHKSFELSNLSSDKPFTIEKTNRWHSLCYPIFNEYRKNFYSNGKRVIDIEYISSLKDVGFAVWYGDCGKLKNKNIILNTNIWGEEGTENIKKYFNYAYFDSEIIKERGRFRLKLGIDSSKEFLELIKPQLPHWFEI